MHKLSDAAVIFKFSNLENEIKLGSELSSLQKCPDHSSNQWEASVQVMWSCIDQSEASI